MSQIVGTDQIKTALLTNANEAIESVDDSEVGFTDLDTRLDSIDALLASAFPSAGWYSACTFATRPAFASINHGHLIVETDTGNYYLGDKSGSLGTAERWVVLPGNRYTTAGLPGATYTILTGTKVYDTTLNTTKIYNGSSWVLQFISGDFTVSSGVVSIIEKDITNPTTSFQIFAAQIM